MTRPNWQHIQDAIRAELATFFESLPDAHVAGAAQGAIVDYGGTHVMPPPPRYNEKHGYWGPHEHQVTLLGITGMGESLAMAIRDWTKCALRTHEAFEAERMA